MNTQGFLVLKAKVNQTITIGNAVVIIKRLDDGTITMAIKAPKEVKIQLT